jgi:hypothetical protein
MNNDPKYAARPDWLPLPTARLPRPTYAPAGMAMGTVLIFWGFITSWIILFVGSGLFAVMLACWIIEIRHERNEP